MIEDTPRPYIIVDNQIIQPISRSPRPDSATVDTELDQEQSFGIVDRVTISKEGLEKSRQQGHTTRQQPLLENRPDRRTQRGQPMLTYSPKGRG